MTELAEFEAQLATHRETIDACAATLEVYNSVIAREDDPAVLEMFTRALGASAVRATTAAATLAALLSTVERGKG